MVKSFKTIHILLILQIVGSTSIFSQLQKRIYCNKKKFVFSHNFYCAKNLIKKIRLVLLYWYWYLSVTSLVDCIFYLRRLLTKTLRKGLGNNSKVSPQSKFLYYMFLLNSNFHAFKILKHIKNL